MDHIKHCKMQQEFQLITGSSWKDEINTSVGGVRLSLSK